MSRSYKKHPWFQLAGDKSWKKTFNRRIRRNNLTDNIDDGNSYKKLNDSWDICDWRAYYSWDEFKKWELDYFKNEKEAYAHWKKHFGSK